MWKLRILDHLMNSKLLAANCNFEKLAKFCVDALSHGKISGCGRIFFPIAAARAGNVTTLSLVSVAASHVGSTVITGQHSES